MLFGFVIRYELMEILRETEALRMLVPWNSLAPAWSLHGMVIFIGCLLVSASPYQGGLSEMSRRHLKSSERLKLSRK